ACSAICSNAPPCQATGTPSRWAEPQMRRRRRSGSTSIAASVTPNADRRPPDPPMAVPRSGAAEPPGPGVAAAADAVPGSGVGTAGGRPEPPVSGVDVHVHLGPRLQLDVVVGGGEVLH